MNVATRVYTGKDIFKVVRLQANIRRFLAQRRLYHILMNPEQYLQGDYSSQYESVNPVNYDNPIVANKLDELNEFEWSDEYSDDLLLQAGLAVTKQKEE